MNGIILSIALLKTNNMRSERKGISESRITENLLANLQVKS